MKNYNILQAIFNKYIYAPLRAAYKNTNTTIQAEIIYKSHKTFYKIRKKNQLEAHINNSAFRCLDSKLQAKQNSLGRELQRHHGKGFFLVPTNLSIVQRCVPEKALIQWSLQKLAVLVEEQHHINCYA